MVSDWKSVSVGEYTKLQGGYAFKSKDFEDFGVPVVKIKNVKHRDIDLTDAGYVDAAVATEAEKYYVKDGNILICMTGSGAQSAKFYSGKVARHRGGDNDFLFNQRVGRFVVSDPDALDEGFLYYFLSPKQKHGVCFNCYRER